MEPTYREFSIIEIFFFSVLREVSRKKKKAGEKPAFS